MDRVERAGRRLCRIWASGVYRRRERDAAVDRHWPEFVRLLTPALVAHLVDGLPSEEARADFKRILSYVQKERTDGASVPRPSAS